MMEIAEIFGVVNDVKYRDWTFTVHPLARCQSGSCEAKDHPYGLTIVFTALDPFTGELGPQRTRTWLLEPVDASELLRTVWLAVMTAEEHEARESFTYRGKHIFGPHKNHLPKEAAVA